VEPDDERERTAVYWEAEFDANGVSDDEAIKRVFDMLVAGMKGIKKMPSRKLQAVRTMTKHAWGA
jgi:hypothetical protein